MRSPIDWFVDWIDERIRRKDAARAWQRSQTPKQEPPPPYQEPHTDRIAMLSTLPMPRVPRCPPVPASVPARQPGATTNVLRQHGHTYDGPKKPGARVRIYERLKQEGKV